MPDTFIRFSDMKDSHPAPIDGANDLLAISHKDINSATGYNSMTVTPNALGAHAVEDQTFVNLETGAKTVEGAINQTLGNFANKYDQTRTYAVDDCVLYAGILYKCIVAISTPEAWDSTHWEQIKAIDVGSGGGGSSADHITLTQAEYDALVEAGTVDPDAFYFIKDTNGDGQNFQPVIFSLEEREIGVWTDGKPLYEKTINFGQLPNNSTKEVAHNVSDVEHIWVVGGFAENPTSGFTNQLNLSGTNSISGQWYTGVNKTVIQIGTNSDRTEYSVCYVTIRYTKSTDQAGSGTWTPQGVPAVHYSTDEQVVGTWIDGSTVYEKVITFSPQLEISYSTWTSTGLDVSNLNIDKIISASCMSSNSYQGDILAYVDNGILKLLTPRNNDVAFVSVLILRYTKSTS